MSPVDIYLDIDGVLVPWFDPAEGIDVRRSGFRDWRGQSLTHDRAEPVRGLRTYSPKMIRRIAALATLGHVQVHWCTTWRTGAHDFAAAVGLPTDWTVLDEDRRWDRYESEHLTPSSWWKRDAVWEHHAVRLDHRVVWIDDDLRSDGGDAAEWIASLNGCGLGISPVTDVGLSAAGLAEVEKFVLTGR